MSKATIELEYLFFPGLLTPSKKKPALPVEIYTISLSTSAEIPPQGLPPE